MSEPTPPLDPQLAELIARHRQAHRAPLDVRARARERLLSAVASPDAPVGGRSGRNVRERLAGIQGKGIALAFVAGALAGASLYAAFAPTPAARLVYVERAAPVLPASTAPVATALTPAPSPAPPPPSSAASPPSSMAGRTSQLSAERILLDEARAAMTQGDSSRARERLERHRRTFSNPILEEEREALWVQALVKQGRGDEARARATVFRRRWPDSIFSSVVDGALDAIRSAD